MSTEPAASPASPSASASAPPPRQQPLVILVVGMAGTGKTTLVHQLQHFADSERIRAYFINLDPAVTDTPYEANMDIRDTIDYKEVLKQYRLGPNGGILTTLNLFATKFHQVISILEKKTDSLDWIVIDTPGQIEVFTWSASGQLITEALAATFPTVTLFVADTSRCQSPQTFMSTMLYSSSIMFKTQLPLLVALNKVDVVDSSFVLRWLEEPDALSEAVQNHKSYSATLTQSLSLFMHEFYGNAKTVSVSAATGFGLPQLRDALAAAKESYCKDFLPLIAARNAKKEVQEQRHLAKQLRQLHRDVSGATTAAKEETERRAD